MIYEIPRGVIVLEGPDGCGKTTLAKTIIERHGGKYMHITYRGENMGKWHLAALRRTIRYCQDQLVIIDRHWLSEQIYANIYRGGTKHDEAARASFGFLKALDAVYVFCLPEIQTCVERHARLHLTGRELYEPDKRIGRVAKLYWSALRGDVEYKNTTYRGMSLLAEIISKGGLASVCQDKLILYDVEKEGEFVVDVADVIVNKVMHSRCTH